MPRFRAVIFDLLTALLDSWTLWGDIAGDDELGARYRRRSLELIYASGAYRPYREIVAEAVGFRTPLTVESRIYGADLNILLALVRSILDAVDTAIIIGHNPGFEELAEALAGDHDEGVRLPTAGLAVVAFDVERWDAARKGTGRLREVATPRTIA